MTEEKNKKKGENAIVELTDTTLSNDMLLLVAEQAEKRIEAVKKIKRIALGITDERDWVDMGGKPYLSVSGAEKIARLFGISWRIDEPKMVYEDAGHYRFEYKGEFEIGTISIEAVGIRSSKSHFFSRRHGKDVPVSEIDARDVKMAAYTNCIGNGITRLLGIRNLTWEDLKEAGINTKKIASVEYRSQVEKKEDFISDAQRKRLFAIARKRFEELGFYGEEYKNAVSNVISKYGFDTTGEITKDVYDEIVKKIESLTLADLLMEHKNLTKQDSSKGGEIA